MGVSVIITCAGKGERAGFNQNKLLVNIGGATCLERTLNAFIKNESITEIIVTASSCDFDVVTKLVSGTAQVVLGGSTRTLSVKNALEHVSNDIVLIHDGARPFVTQSIINNVIYTAKAFGSAVTAIPSNDTILKADDTVVDNYVGKEGLYLVQTPQGFNTEQIKKAYALAGNETYPDDACVYSKFISPAKIVAGSKTNIKLTYKEDFELLTSTPICHVGVGFDCHKLVEGRKLILGGIEIPHNKGLLGHSDADVLTHAIMDAMLSACAMRDIGYHFPDTDERFKGACSITLLKEVVEIVQQKGFRVQNVSATIMAEKPKLIKHIPAITYNLANVLGLSVESIGIGATTLEGLGFVGREEGICVKASVTLIN